MKEFGKKELQSQLEFFKKKEGAFVSFDGYEPLKKKYVSEDEFKDGKDILEKAGVAILVLAGGMGSRLNFNHPKGCFPISVVKHKSLFQLICEKVLAAEKKYLKGKNFQIAFALSLQNRDETVSFFKENNFFGLKSSQVHFFSQEELSFLDDEGNYSFDKEGNVLSGPNGNGGILETLITSSFFNVLKENDIKYLNVIPVDNPLADPWILIYWVFIKKDKLIFLQ